MPFENFNVWPLVKLYKELKRVTVESIEAFAANAAVQFAKDLSIHKLEIKGDSLLVILALRDNRPSYVLHGHFMEETKILSKSLQWFNFKYVKRGGNCLAHALARRKVHNLLFGTSHYHMANLNPQ